MRGIELEDSCYQDIEWTADLEVHLLFAMVGIKPVGLHRSLHMFGIHYKFTSSINKNVPPKAIWKHLETMYDLATLDEAEGLKFPMNDFEEFSLPREEFEELMTPKRKGLAIVLETTDESSSDVVLGSLIDKEAKENDDNLETVKVEETDETANVPSARKNKLSLSLKKRRRNEEEKNKGDNTTSDEGVDESFKKKRTKRESENSEIKEENQKIVSEGDDGKNIEDKEEEPVVRSQILRGRKQAKNKKNKKSNVEDEKVDDVKENETKQDPVPSSVIPETIDNEKEADDKKEKASPAKPKESKLRRKASTEKSEEGTDVEGAEEDVKITRKLDSGIVNTPESTVGKSETKKRTRKQDEELEKKPVKEIETSTSKRGNKETKPVTSSQKRFRKDDTQDDKVDTDDELYSKRISISSPALKGVEEQVDDSDGKRLAKDDKKKGKRERIVSDETKKLRRGSLKAPQVANLKNEGVESRRLSRGDDSSKAYSSDDMEASKMSDTERNVTKRDSVTKSDPRKAERTYSRAKKTDTSLTQVEADIPPVSTPAAKKDRQRDSMAKSNTEESNKRKSTPATSMKRAARSVTSIPEPTPKRRRAN